tara:strand:- start:391 stop:513 length:123 start_codon:yes stop_codon:yes gene_type:complete
MSWLSFIIGFGCGLALAGAGLLILIKWDNERYHKIKREDK